MKKTVVYTIGIVSLLGLIGLAAAVLAKDMWVAELLVSFVPLLSIILLSLFGLSALLYSTWIKPAATRRRRLIVPVTAFSIVVALFVIIPLANSGSSSALTPSATRSSIRMAQFNRLHDNRKLADIAAYIVERKIDVVVFEETDRTALESIASQAGYGHHYSSQQAGLPSDSAVGIVSRLPLENTSAQILSDGYAVVRGEIVTSSGLRVAAYGAHLTPPFANDMYRKGVLDMSSLAYLVKNDSLPVLLGADFNTTVYSPKMRSFTASTSTKLKSTTPALPDCSWYGAGPVLCMRIDHIFVPESAVVSNVTISKDLGSDHRMVIADIEL